MYKIVIYDSPEVSYKPIDVLLTEENIVDTIEIKTPPTTEKEFNELADKIEYEGFMYELFNSKDDSLCSGIFTNDSLYDDFQSLGHLK